VNAFVTAAAPAFVNEMGIVEDSETGEIRIHVDYRDGIALIAFYRYEWCRAALALVKGGGFPPPTSSSSPPRMRSKPHAREIVQTEHFRSHLLPPSSFATARYLPRGAPVVAAK